MVPISLIWAQARNGVIGARNGIPWHLPEDLAHFKEITMGDTVIMGRRTWESLPKAFRPLPGRRNIVITRQRGWSADGAETLPDLESAIHVAQHCKSPSGRPNGLIHVIGGGSLYRQALRYAGMAYVTVVDIEPEGDTFAPAMPDWTAVQRGPWQTSAAGLRYRFDVLVPDLDAPRY